MKKSRFLSGLVIACLVWALGPGAVRAQPQPQPQPQPQTQTQTQTSADQPLIEADPLDPADFPAATEGSRHAARPALTFWCSSFPPEQGWAVSVTREWNALHPERRVQLQAMPTGQLAEEVLREALERGTAPDLTNHLFPVDAHRFAEQGVLLPLEGHSRLMEHLGRRSGAAAGQLFLSKDGHLYQFPWKNNPVLLQYNVQLLRQRGIRLPRTFSEFLQAGRLLAGTEGQQRIWLWAPSPTPAYWERYYDFLPLFLAASGGQSLLTPQGRAAFDNDAGRKVMAFLADLYRQGAAPGENLYPDAESSTRGFVKGELAMRMTGPWSIEEVRDAGGESVVFDFTGLPVPDGTASASPVYTYGNFRNFGVFRNCRNPDLACEFIEFATSRQNDLALLQDAGQLPFRQGLTCEPDFVAVLHRTPGPLVKFALQSPWVRPLENAPDLHEVLGILSEELMLCTVQGRKDPARALQDAARRVDARGPGTSRQAP